MNKEFRVWRFCHAENKHKFYYTSKPFMVCGSGATLVFPTDENAEWVDDSLCEIDESNIQQYTGLTDSTGKKIFEGDIVDYRYDGMEEFEKERMKDLLVSPVYWEVDRWRIKYSAAGYAWHIMKVIGNIFENPELIK